MSKRTFIVLLGVGLLATSMLVASNMGFKLNYLLEATGASSASGTNTIALPYNPQSGLNNVGDLFNDIGGVGVVQEVQTFLRSSDSFNVYSGAKGQIADPIVQGEGIRIRMAVDTNYIIAGAHDPAAAITLYAAGDVTPDGVSASGTNEFSVPYHTTANNSGDIFNDIGAANVQEVQTFLRASDSFNVYQGAKGQIADPVTPGTALRIRMATTTAYVPSHY